MQAHSSGCPECKSLLGREHDGGLCILVHGWHVAAKLIDPDCPISRKHLRHDGDVLGATHPQQQGKEITL
jgi:hypothetical protein